VIEHPENATRKKVYSESGECRKEIGQRNVQECNDPMHLSSSMMRKGALF